MKSPESDNAQVEVGRVASLEQMSGESVQTKSPPSPLAAESCIELLHGLNNAFAAVLMNAQVLDSKLPSYSRSKRYIHEIERSAQRGAALLKRLLDRLPADESGAAAGKGFELCKVPPVAERMAVANQGSSATAESVINVASFAAAHAAPAFCPAMSDAHKKV